MRTESFLQKQKIIIQYINKKSNNGNKRDY